MEIMVFLGIFMSLNDIQSFCERDYSISVKHDGFKLIRITCTGGFLLVFNQGSFGFKNQLILSLNFWTIADPIFSLMHLYLTKCAIEIRRCLEAKELFKFFWFDLILKSSKWRCSK